MQMNYAPLIAAAAELVMFIVRASGEPLEAVQKRVAEKCAKAAQDPSDETDDVSKLIDGSLP